MSVKSRSILQKLGVKLIALSMIMLGLLFMVDLSLRPVIETMNTLQCHEALSVILNDAVNAELERCGAEYSKFVTLSTNDSGEVISIESNVSNINSLKTNIAARVQREIERISSIDIEIPIGTLLGIQMLHGKGFDVGMSVQPLGTAKTTVISEFNEAGINQTLHRIVIEIDAEVDAVIPGFSSRVPVSTSIVAAETVIVGRVPEAYTHIITATDDIAGLVNDFGAVVPD